MGTPGARASSPHLASFVSPKEERAGSPRSGFFLHVGAALALLLAGAARAQVMEIGDDGSVTTYSGPTQFLTSGARPLTPPPAGRTAGAQPPSAAIAQAIDAASARHQVDPRLAEAVAWRESRFDPSALSPKGARGVMQLMPATAQALGVDAADPAGNIEGGVGYLSQMIRRFGGDLTKALAAYNAGPGAVERYGGVPPYAETIAYVDAVLARFNRAAPTAPGIPR
ncbi:MAG TPA: lytic transglycosylase domain-containing protein [Caulobacteraceae bacterium]|nr:lytic transglycosylase domain-containing protein [Caulobacteraceae bacterium]